MFENGKTGGFLLFIRNFQMTLGASGALTASAKIQYLSKLLCGEVLGKLDMLPVEVGSTSATHLNHILLVLGAYVFPINALSKKNRVMCRRMRKPCELK